MNGKPYHYIDKDIRYLVACMNAHEFRTYASCQGTGYRLIPLCLISLSPRLLRRPHGSASVCVKMLNQEILY
jgi:hypothetical protein